MGENRISMGTDDGMNEEDVSIPGDILRNAKKLLSDPDRWTLGGTKPGFGTIQFSSVTADGIGCHYADPEAYRFCALDGVYYVGTIKPEAPEPRATSFMNHPATIAASEYLLYEAMALGHPGWTGLNDMGHAEVLAAFDRAIERERAGLSRVVVADLRRGIRPTFAETSDARTKRNAVK